MCKPSNVPLANHTEVTDQLIKISEINHAGVEEKFVNSIIHFNQFGEQINKSGMNNPNFLKVV